MTDFELYQFPSRDDMIKNINEYNKKIFVKVPYPNASVLSNMMIKCLYFVYNEMPNDYEKYMTSKYPIELNGIVNLTLYIFEPDKCEGKIYHKRCVECKNPFALRNEAIECYNRGDLNKYKLYLEESVQLGWLPALEDISEMFREQFNESLAIKYYTNWILCIYEGLILNYDIEPLSVLKEYKNIIEHRYMKDFNTEIYPFPTIKFFNRIPWNICVSVINNVEKEYIKLNSIMDKFKKLISIVGLLNIIRLYICVDL